MTNYDQIMRRELFTWQRKMMRKPGILNRLSKRAQDKLNSIIPEKVHNAITVAIKQMVRGVVFGAKLTTREKVVQLKLEATDATVEEIIKRSRTPATVEGALTG